MLHALLLITLDKAEYKISLSGWIPIQLSCYHRISMDESETTKNNFQSMDISLEETDCEIVCKYSGCF